MVPLSLYDPYGLVLSFSVSKTRVYKKLFICFGALVI